MTSTFGEDAQVAPAGTWLLILGGAAASWLVTLQASYITHRYQHDLFPLLVIGGALGIAAVE